MVQLNRLIAADVVADLNTRASSSLMSVLDLEVMRKLMKSIRSSLIRLSTLAT